MNLFFIQLSGASSARHQQILKSWYCLQHGLPACAGSTRLNRSSVLHIQSYAPSLCGRGDGSEETYRWDMEYTCSCGAETRQAAVAGGGLLYV